MKARRRTMARLTRTEMDKMMAVERMTQMVRILGRKWNCHHLSNRWMNQMLMMMTIGVIRSLEMMTIMPVRTLCTLKVHVHRDRHLVVLIVTMMTTTVSGGTRMMGVYRGDGGLLREGVTDRLLKVVGGETSASAKTSRRMATFVIGGGDQASVTGVGRRSGTTSATMGVSDGVVADAVVMTTGFVGTEAPLGGMSVGAGAIQTGTVMRWNVVAEAGGVMSGRDHRP